MASFFDSLLVEYRKGFYVNISKERINLEQTSKYIARYARRPPLSEVRIKNYTGDTVTFEFKDYRNQGSKVLNTVRTFEFIKRLTRHIPPHYFNVIRHYGILASRVKSTYKAITDKLLGNLPGVERTQDLRERQTAYKSQDSLICRICRICHRVMQLVSIYLPNPLFLVKRRLQAAFP